MKTFASRHHFLPSRLGSPYRVVACNNKEQLGDAGSVVSHECEKKQAWIVGLYTERQDSHFLTINNVYSKSTRKTRALKLTGYAQSRLCHNSACAPFQRRFASVISSDLSRRCTRMLLFSMHYMYDVVPLFGNARAALHVGHMFVMTDL
jgi:hypothetical protein